MIKMRDLRKDFTVRVKAGRLRREKRTVAAVEPVPSMPPQYSPLAQH